MDEKGGDAILTVTHTTCEDQVFGRDPELCVRGVYLEWPLWCVLTFGNIVSHAASSAITQAESVKERFVAFLVAPVRLL